jgi:hypothetical protein
MPFGFELADMTSEIGALKKRKNLAKETGGVTHFDLRG